MICRRGMRFRALAVVPFLAVLGVMATSCGGSGGGAGADAYGESDPVVITKRSVTVEMKGIAFEPRGMTIRPGTTVTWVNKDPVSHNVGQVQSEFLSPDVMEAGEEFNFTFDRPGKYRYQCTYHHPNMNGVVIVEEE